MADGAWIWEAAGWSEFNQPDDIFWYEPSEEDRKRTIEEPENPFAALPADLSPPDVEGIWVHAFNLDEPDNESYFWVRTYLRLDTWEEWNDLVALTMDMCDMSLA